MARFKLTEEQAETSSRRKLRHLARLEEMKIRGEQEELAEERDELEAILKQQGASCSKLIKDELLADAKKYGDDRRSPLVERAARRRRSTRPSWWPTSR